MLLTKLRHLARAPESRFAAVDHPPDAEAFGGADLARAEAEVVEGRDLRAIPVGSPEPSRFTAFLDGIQRSTVALYQGPVPIVYAYAAAVIRTRRSRRMRTLSGGAGAANPADRSAGAERAETGASRSRYLREREAVFFPFRLVDAGEVAVAGIGVDAMVDTGPEGDEPIPLFPPLLYARAEARINRWREALEVELADRWCARGDDAGWLLVDGSLTLSPTLAASPRAVGVVKGHRTRFFDGEEARVLAGLQAGERTSIFRPETRRFTPVHSWYLRLRRPAGRDIFWGLVRVEAAADDTGPEQADAISHWLLAEAAPLALPDARWDRLLYPIRDCEEYLRSRAPGLGVA